MRQCQKVTSHCHSRSSVALELRRTHKWASLFVTMSVLEAFKGQPGLAILRSYRYLHQSLLDIAHIHLYLPMRHHTVPEASAVQVRSVRYSRIPYHYDIFSLWVYKVPPNPLAEVFSIIQYSILNLFSSIHIFLFPYPSFQSLRQHGGRRYCNARATCLHHIRTYIYRPHQHTTIRTRPFCNPRVEKGSQRSASRYQFAISNIEPRCKPPRVHPRRAGRSNRDWSFR